MRLKLVILFCCLSFTVRAQRDYEYFNGPAFWSKISFDDGDKGCCSSSDTFCLVASNRILQPDSIRFIGEMRDEKELHYYFVSSKGGKWHVRKLHNLSEAIALVPRIQNDWVVYAEGMGKVFSADVDRAMQMNAQYHVNVLLLDYPSLRTDRKALRNYWFAMHQAKIGYKDFLPVIDSMKTLKGQNKFGGAKMSMFFHSMGNNILREIILHSRLQEINQTIWIDNLVLNAPCVPSCRHYHWIDSIQFAKAVFVHYNEHDGTLKWARIIGFHQVLGEHVKKPLSKRAFYVSFHLLCGTSHSNFLSLHGRPPTKPAAQRYYNLLLHGNVPDFTDDTKFRRSAYKDIGYQILP